MKNVRFIFVCVLGLLVNTVTAQDKFFKKITLHISPDSSYIISPDFIFTSVSIEFSQQEIKDAYIAIGERKEPLRRDEHTDPDCNFTVPVIYTSGAVRMQLYSGNLEGLINIYFHFAPPIRLHHALPFYKHTCPKPDDIPQSIWRDGLPPPTGTRTISTVRHLVVHHSAGSNTDTDYINVVRNIYLYHLNQNGWDDIGYNYLIAQDGTIFKGRDAKGAGDEDDILGAHFCAKNTGTMGVCLLGNYELVKPTLETLESLTTLLTWKCAKENLLPDDMELHPATGGPNAVYQKHIIGHRNGCATECPGDSTYLLLQQIRNEVRQQLLDCAPTVSVEVSNKEAFKVYPNPANDKLHIDCRELSGTILLYDAVGKLLAAVEIVTGNEEIDVTGLSPGLYMLCLKDFRTGIVIK